MKDHYSTRTKISTVFKCKNNHLIAGIVILKNGKGYVCPYCSTTVEDVTEEQDGRDFFEIVRPDLQSPPPLRTPL